MTKGVKCTDCGWTIYPKTEAYKLARRNQQWEPICMDCWKKLVKAKGGNYADLKIDLDKNKADVEIKKVEE